MHSCFMKFSINHYGVNKFHDNLNWFLLECSANSLQCINKSINKDNCYRVYWYRNYTFFVTDNNQGGKQPSNSIKRNLPKKHSKRVTICHSKCLRWHSREREREGESEITPQSIKHSTEFQLLLKLNPKLTWENKTMDLERATSK